MYASPMCRPDCEGLCPLLGQAPIMNYSICMLDAGGRTQRTEFTPHDNDDAALEHARREIQTSPIVEVWKDGNLVERLFQEPLQVRVQI